MSDGNTAIQVSPVVLEGEAMRIFNFLNGAANAIVERSTLAKEVGEMQAEIKQLRADCETFASAKDNLGERLGWTRNELSDEQAKNSELIRTNYNQAQIIRELEETRERQAGRIERLTVERDLWITSSNDNEFQLLQTQDHLASAEKTLADIRHAMGWKEPEAPAIDSGDVDGKDVTVKAPGSVDYGINDPVIDEPTPYFPPSDIAEVKPEEEYRGFDTTSFPYDSHYDRN